jgi:hypothetical protein
LIEVYPRFLHTLTALTLHSEPTRRSLPLLPPPPCCAAVATHVAKSPRAPPHQPPSKLNRPQNHTGDCKVQLKAWDQCGGKSNAQCPGPKCVGAAWEDHCCPSGYDCVGHDDYWFQCTNNGNQQQQQNNNGNNQQQQNGNGGDQQAQKKKIKPGPAIALKKAANGEPLCSALLGVI